jgi:hypothetical protein
MLSPHVFVCVSGSYVVVLDLRADRYFALHRAQAARLGSRVAGWPLAADAGAKGSVAASDGDEDLAQRLLREGVLTADPQQGKAATPVSIPPPSEELTSSPDQDPVPIRMLDVLRYLWACLSARCALKFLGIERVVARMQARKARHTDKAGEHDAQALRGRLAVAERLRPFVFSGRDACLFEALMLVHFLGHRGISTRWIFGVQMAPFSAHCWLQHEGLVLNDTMEHAGAYTPIMIV